MRQTHATRICLQIAGMRQIQPVLKPVVEVLVVSGQLAIQFTILPWVANIQPARHTVLVDPALDRPVAFQLLD